MAPFTVWAVLHRLGRPEHGRERNDGQNLKRLAYLALADPYCKPSEIGPYVLELGPVTMMFYVLFANLEEGF
ncbi:hypothetical protein AAE478_002316 [Parahypoxylon ruwenzoriense]